MPKYYNLIIKPINDTNVPKEAAFACSTSEQSDLGFFGFSFSLRLAIGGVIKLGRKCGVWGLRTYG